MELLFYRPLGMTMPRIIAAGLGAVAANPHIAPTAAGIPARIHKQPTTLAALPDALQPIGC